MYFTGIGGFQHSVEGAGSYYRAPAGAMLGTGAGFTASALFTADSPSSSSADGSAIFDATNGVGPVTAGWRIWTALNAGDLLIGAYVVGSAGVLTPQFLISSFASIAARPLFIATLVLDPAVGADGSAELFVNATHYNAAAFAEGNAFVPAAGNTQAAVGNQNENPIQSALGVQVLGCGFSTAAITREQAFRHQLACLEAGDFVDGAQGAGYSAGVPTFTNLYSARRGNSAFGSNTFITGQKDGLSVGSVPQAAAAWPDENGNPARDLERVDDGVLPPCYSIGFKRVG